jgi:hypothetical protein
MQRFTLASLNRLHFGETGFYCQKFGELQYPPGVSTGIGITRFDNIRQDKKRFE